MPTVKLRKRVSPASQVNGFYVHSSPPKGHYRLLADIEDVQSTFYVHTFPPRVLQMNPSIIRQWLRGGEIDQLEQVVLEGQGHKLIGEYAPDPKVRNFLKEVPNYMSRIGELNDAVNKGSLRQLQALLPKEDETFMKNIIFAKDHSGVGLLHKAVYNDHPDIVQWLVKKFPETVNLKDRDGKTALHYCGACADPDAMWEVLAAAGADTSILDAKGHNPAYYMEHSGEIQLPEPKLPSPGMKRFTSGKNGLVVKPSNIRIWIHDRDLGRLQQVLWEGHGNKLRVETSNNPRVKRFLDGVPFIMNAIKDLHSAVINNDMALYQKKSSDPIPHEILASKDANGLTPLHKAAGLGHLEFVKDIINKYPKALHLTDSEGRSPLHYAAALKDQGRIYNYLLDHGADEMAVDKNGKMPAYYTNNAKDLPTKFLELIPEAPRTAVTFPPSWDWSVLQASPQIDPNFNHIDSRLLNNKRFGDDVINEDYQYGSGVDVWRNEEALPFINGNSADEEVKKAEERRKADEERKRREKEEYEEMRRREEEKIRKEREDEMIRMKEEEKLKRMAKEEEKLQRMAKEEERREQELAEERQRLLDEGLVVREEDTGGDEVDKLIKQGDMELLAEHVLDGNGVELLGRNSDNAEIQNFLDNIPTYMKKIATVHQAAREGELRKLQATLDRRRFAIAKDTPTKVTPLHLATLFGRTAIVKYLGGRFPETLIVTDINGRTALHYAASIPDNGHFFNILVNLGANRNSNDHYGHTAQYYLDHPGQLTQEELLKEISAPAQMAREMLSDKVPHDKVSSRRRLDDPDILVMLEKCYETVKTARENHSDIPLVKHLTRTKFDLIKNRITKNDHTLLDVIWPGIRALQVPEERLEETSGCIAPDYETYIVFDDLLRPVINDLHGFGEKLPNHPKTKFFEKGSTWKVADPDQTGVVAPDAESYEVYPEVLEPIINDIHGSVKHSDQKPFKTTKTQILRENRLKSKPPPEEVVVDSSGKYVLAVKIEATRNLKDYQLPRSLHLQELDEVERRLKSALRYHSVIGKIPGFSESGDEDRYVSVEEILDGPSGVRTRLAANDLLIPLSDTAKTQYAKLLHGLHWPDHRGVHLASSGNIAVWVNVQDHIRVVSCSSLNKPGDINEAYRNLAGLLIAFDDHMPAKKSSLGHITSRPSCLGTTLKFQVLIRLPRMPYEAIEEICRERKLEVVETDLGDKVYRIKNRQSLGVTEWESFENVRRTLRELVLAEKSLAEEKTRQVGKIIKNIFSKNIGK